MGETKTVFEQTFKNIDDVLCKAELNERG